MKIFSSIILITLVVVSGIYSFNTKKKYDNLRDTLGAPLITVTMTTETEQLYNDLVKNWKVDFNQIGGSDSQALKSINLKPSVKNWIHVVTYVLPEYKLFSLTENKKSVLTAMTRNLLCPVSVDNYIHLSNDSKTALIRIKENSVFVLSDENSDIRIIKYTKQ